MRNFGIIAHVDAGKTTCTERILYIAGAQHTSGDVDDGNTTTDYDSVEQDRGITIKAACVACEWNAHELSLIDTPGHIDFTVEVQRSLAVLDGAVVVFSAVHGVQAQSETVWRQADRFGVPRLCFINKMDVLGADFDAVVEQIQSRLGARSLCVQMPLGRESGFRGVIDLLSLRQFRFDRDEKGSEIADAFIDADLQEEAERRRRQLVAAVADIDDEIAGVYLAELQPTAAQLAAAIRRACIAGKGFPVLCGSAHAYTGIQPLLDAVVAYLPSPLERKVRGRDPRHGGREVECLADPAQALAGLAFKTLHDDFGALTLVRVYSGTLRKGQRVWNARLQRQEKVERLYRMQGARATTIDQAIAGQIVAVSGLRETVTGDTLCEESHPLLLEAPSFPQAVISMALEPVASGDSHKLAAALSKLAKEDPTFTHAFDSQTGQLVVSGMGELHLETIRSKLARDHRVEVNFGAPRVAYRETLTATGRAEARHIKRNGGLGQFAVCTLVVEPLRNDEPGHVAFASAIVGGVVPKEYVAAIERGARMAAAAGVLGSGFPLIHVRATVVDGQTHAQDSSSLAFEKAGFDAFRLAAQQAQPILLEPYMALEVLTPESSMGMIMGDLSARRVEIVDVSDRGHLKVIRGHAPLSEMFAYSSASRSLSSGRATFSLEPLDYRPVPRSKYACVLKQ